MFTLHTADEKAVEIAPIMEILGKSSDMNLVTANISDFLSESGVCWIRFGEEEQQAVKVRRLNVRQAITAASDFLRYGKYDHPESGPGLHLNANVDMNDPLIEDAGVVRSSYTGVYVPAPPMVNGQHVWHQVSVNLGNVQITPMFGKYADVRAAKHDFVEYMMRGYALQVWIAPIRDYAAPFITQFMTDDEKARQFRSERLTASRLRKKVIKPAGYDAWKRTNSAREQKEDVNLPDELWVETLEGQAVDLMTIQGPANVQLYLGAIPVQKLVWDTSDTGKMLTMQDVLAAEDFVCSIL